MGVSDGYVRLTAPEEIAAARALADAWKDPAIPDRQLAVSEPELARFRRGEVSPPFDAFCAAMDQTGLDWRGGERSRLIRVLEVGTSTGYYADVMRHCGFGGYFLGADYSEPMILRAIQLRAADRNAFEVCDARRLRWPSRLFDVVVSGCCMLHMEDYREALAEASRVSAAWVILHRNPIAAGPTEFWRKNAYDVPCLEIHFGRDDLLAACAEAGLEVTFAHRISSAPDGSSNETWLASRVR